MSFPRYSNYKNSGVEWLGSVPEHWEVLRAAHLFREVAEQGSEGLPILSVSIHDGVSDDELSADELDRKVTRSDDRSKYKKVAPGDLVYNMMRAWQGGFGTVRVTGMVSPAYVVARPKSRFSTIFVEHLLRTPQAVEEMRRHSHGVTDFRLRLYWDRFKDLYLTLPPFEEQNAIISFLERETAKIDALVEEQKRLIELLKEKRHAVISQVITKGHDPHMTMKATGVEWLGEVPSSWQVMPLKRDLRYLTSGSRGWAEHYSDDGPLFLRIGNLTRDSIALDLVEQQRVTVPTGSEGERTRTCPGDILFSITAYLGSVALVPLNLERAYVSQHIALARLHGKYLIPEWVAYVSLSSAGKAHFEAQAYGGTKIQLSLDDIRNLLIPTPSLAEQAALVTFIDSETRKFSELIADASVAINFLQERRVALISDAVTGKIDVRGFVKANAPAPEMVAA